MSKRRQVDKPASEDRIKACVREAIGHPRYGSVQLARRLKCSGCKKTWKFSDRLNFSPCSACKIGRLS